MIVKLLQPFYKSKSEVEFIKSYRLRSRFLLILAILMVGLNLALQLPVYSKGVLLGMSLSLWLLALRNMLILRKPHQLRELYIKGKDERTAKIRQMSSSITLLVQVILILICLMLNAFWQVDINFRLFLISDLYLILIVLYGAQALLEKQM